MPGVTVGLGRELFGVLPRFDAFSISKSQLA
jgi:hypothetical protein